MLLFGTCSISLKHKVLFYFFLGVLFRRPLWSKFQINQENIPIYIYFLNDKTAFKEIINKRKLFFFFTKSFCMCVCKVWTLPFTSLRRKSCKQIFHLLIHNYLGDSFLVWKIPFFHLPWVSYWWTFTSRKGQIRCLLDKSIIFCNTFTEYTSVLFKSLLFESIFIYI